MTTTFDTSAPELHRCACDVCTPALRVEGPRRGPDHFAVRLDEGDGLCNVELDGQLVWDCYEAVAGEHGTVWRYSNPAHVCSCGSRQYCRYVATGRVVVTRPEALSPEVAEREVILR